MSKGEIVSVCVVGMVFSKINFDVKANIDCDICYFDVVARIQELVVIKFDFWPGGLAGVLEDVPEGIPIRDFRRQLQISRYEFIWITTDIQIYFKQEDHVQLYSNPKRCHISRDKTLKIKV